MKSLTTKFLFIVSLFFFLAACQKESESSNSPTNSNNTPTGGGNSDWDMEATLTMDNGDVIDFHCNFDLSAPYFHPFVESEPGDSFSYIYIPGSFLQNNLIIYGSITGPGDYHFTDFPEDGEFGGNIDLKSLDENTSSLDHYMNYDVGAEPATLHVTSFSNNHITATFSGLLYQEGGNKVVTITNGTLDTDLSTDSY